MNKATLSQILKTMHMLRWVSRDKKGLFEIGEGICDFSKSAFVNMKLEQASIEAAKKLNAELNEVVAVATFSNGLRHLLAKYEANHIVKIDEIVSSFPETMVTTATGLILLAGMEDEAIEIFASKHGMEKEISKLRGKLEEFRRNGYSEISIGNNDAVSMATGIYAPDGNMIAAIGFSAPRYRFKMNTEDAVKILRKYADRISKKL